MAVDFFDAIRNTKSIFRTLSNICDEIFCESNGFFAKISITVVWQCPKYASEYFQHNTKENLETVMYSMHCLPFQTLRSKEHFEGVSISVNFIPTNFLGHPSGKMGGGWRLADRKSLNLVRLKKSVCHSLKSIFPILWCFSWFLIKITKFFFYK